MKCPFCVEQGLRSKIYPRGGGFVTLMGTRSFYDEDGNGHDHDPNWRTSSYRCSNLHNWSRSSRGGCCDDDPVEENIRREPDSFRCGGCGFVIEPRYPHSGHLSTCSVEFAKT